MDFLIELNCRVRHSWAPEVFDRCSQLPRSRAWRVKHRRSPRADGAGVVSGMGHSRDKRTGYGLLHMQPRQQSASPHFLKFRQTKYRKAVARAQRTALNQRHARLGARRLRVAGVAESSSPASASAEIKTSGIPANSCPGTRARARRRTRRFGLAALAVLQSVA
jgi:hypothetical protein